MTSLGARRSQLRPSSADDRTAPRSTGARSPACCHPPSSAPYPARDREPIMIHTVSGELRRVQVTVNGVLRDEQVDPRLTWPISCGNSWG